MLFDTFVPVDLVVFPFNFPQYLEYLVSEKGGRSLYWDNALIYSPLLDNFSGSNSSDNSFAKTKFDH